MNTPSPLIPQGATPPRPKNSLYIKILMVLSVHVVVIGGMLVQGCNNTSTKDQAKLDGTTPPPNDTAAASVPPANTTPATPPMETAPVTNPSLTAATIATPPAATPGAMAAPTIGGLVPPARSTDLIPPAAQGEPKEYVIVKGDTLAAIAHKNGLSLKALEEANPNVNAKKLQIGQKVQIPAGTAALATTKEAAPGTAAEAAPGDGTVYVVKSGDILLKIAKAHGTTVKKIMAMNELKSTSIRAGQKLKLPAAKTSTTEPAATPAATTTVSAALAPAATPMKVSGSPVAAN
jgi:LysM repeat protein